MECKNYSIMFGMQNVLFLLDLLSKKFTGILI